MSVQVLYVSQRLLEMGCYEISLGDTIGTGAAGSTHRLLNTIVKSIPAERLAVHFHDTYGQVCTCYAIWLSTMYIVWLYICSVSMLYYYMHWPLLLLLQALTNILVSLDYGISVVDASVSGLGGCPYAKGEWVYVCVCMYISIML